MRNLIVALSIFCVIRCDCFGQQKPKNEADRRAGASAAKSVFDRPKSQSPASRSGEDEPKPAGMAAAPIDPHTYVIGAEDILAVQVWQEPRISGFVAVRPDGKISLQMANEVTAAGMTPEKLAGLIADRLKKYINNPDVSVQVQQVNSKKYYINGEVLKPGAFPLVVPTRVLEALVNAGGFKDFANLKKIYILRGNERLRFNYKDVSQGKNLSQNIYLEPGDQIIIR